MTSTEHQLATSNALNASPHPDTASFEIIDAPGPDVIQPILSEGAPDADTEVPVHTEVQNAADVEHRLTIGTGDTAVKPAIFIHALLYEPLVVHAIASRARALLLKDFARIKSAIEPLRESPQPNLDLSALTMQAAVHALLSTSSYTSEFCSRVALQPVLATLATHPMSDPGSLAFAYVLINSAEGDELARKAAEVYAVRVRDWFALRVAQAKPAYASLTGAARIVWEQTAEWVCHRCFFQ